MTGWSDDVTTGFRHSFSFRSKKRRRMKKGPLILRIAGLSDY
jgi:hypothetical protein